MSSISTIYERSFYNQMHDYFDSAEGTVLSTVSFIWLKKLNKKEIIITFLLQSLQTCLKHLIVSTMNFSLPNSMLTVSIVLSLKFISDYLNFRKQKVGSTFSDYLNILFGVPHKSIAVPLNFNISTSDTFF